MALELWRPKRALARGPWQELERIEEEVEEMVRSFSRRFPWDWLKGRGEGWMPPVDMVERKDEIVLRADLPGMQEKDIESLTVCWSRTRSLEELRRAFRRARSA